MPPTPYSVSTHHRDDGAVADVLELRMRMLNDRVHIELSAAIANTEHARDVDDVDLLDLALQELGASTLLALSNLRAKTGRVRA